MTGKRIRVYVDDDFYGLLTRMSQQTGRSVSALVREMLTQAIRKDMQETALLSSLLRKLEKLEEQKSERVGSDEMILVEIGRTLEATKAVVECLIAFSREFFIDRAKQERFERTAREILEKT